MKPKSLNTPRLSREEAYARRVERYADAYGGSDPAVRYMRRFPPPHNSTCGCPFCTGFDE